MLLIKANNPIIKSKQGRTALKQLMKCLLAQKPKIHPQTKPPVLKSKEGGLSEESSEEQPPSECLGPGGLVTSYTITLKIHEWALWLAFYRRWHGQGRYGLWTQMKYGNIRI